MVAFRHTVTAAKGALANWTLVTFLPLGQPIPSLRTACTPLPWPLSAMDLAALDILWETSTIKRTGTHTDLDPAVEPRHHNKDTLFTPEAIAAEGLYTNLSSSTKAESIKLSASTEDAPRLICTTRLIYTTMRRSIPFKADALNRDCQVPTSDQDQWRHDVANEPVGTR